jgi:hypothetical protein
MERERERESERERWGKLTGALKEPKGIKGKSGIMLYLEYQGSILLRNVGKYSPNYKGVRPQKAKILKFSKFQKRRQICYSLRRHI